MKHQLKMCGTLRIKRQHLIIEIMSIWLHVGVLFMYPHKVYSEVNNFMRVACVVTD